ncbi:hypothetical protein PHLCEN_2v8637 [Hermanssonia centrifuga]|uniref:Uncharacterized protein n=1 Tax=Hermanssonia centrifuga TaxID=98765 RepID=A0A2R6NT29_9APHY|nr:hypothetical protein PHLCEN_2v8637 [Hermanssonia centrifuga]
MSGIMAAVVQTAFAARIWLLTNSRWGRVFIVTLLNMKTGFSATDDIVNRLVRLVIETGSLTGPIMVNALAGRSMGSPTSQNGMNSAHALQESFIARDISLQEIEFDLGTHLVNGSGGFT